jgi:pseudo-rSAM protein
LEPFVYVSIKKENLFLYNTLNRKILEYNNKPILINLVKQLQAKKNLLVIKLDNEYINRNREISNFIKDVRESFMGDLIDTSSSSVKPIQMMPYLNIQRDIHRAERESRFDIGKDIMNHLNEVTIFVNNRCDRHCKMCSSAYKQFLCCYKEADHPNELSIKYIQNIIDAINVRESRVCKINILGGNILKYSKIETLVSLLNTTNIPKSYYVHYLNLINQKDRMIRITNKWSGLNIQILVHFPIKKNVFENLMPLITGTNINPGFILVIEKEDDIKSAQAFVSLSGIDNYSFTPYFNGKNLLFFRKHVFITKQNIFEFKPSITDILSKKVVNRSLYGSITILSNGDIKTNLNFDKIGNIKKDSIRHAIYNQLKEGKMSILYNTWWRTRDQIEVCKHCHYNLLCPSISNYELAIGRNNLCRITGKS